MTAEMLRPQAAANDDLPWREGWPQAKVTPAPGVTWGLGWGLQEAGGRQALWHWGDNGDYKAFTLLYPAEGEGVALFSNGRGGGRLWRPVVETFFPGPHPSALSSKQKRLQAF